MSTFFYARSVGRFSQGSMRNSRIWLWKSPDRTQSSNIVELTISVHNAPRVKVCQARWWRTQVSCGYTSGVGRAGTRHEGIFLSNAKERHLSRRKAEPLNSSVYEVEDSESVAGRQINHQRQLVRALVLPRHGVCLRQRRGILPRLQLLRTTALVRS